MNLKSKQLNDEGVDAIIRLADIDEDGQVNYSELLNTLRNQAQRG